jgi:hypothetical protein
MQNNMSLFGLSPMTVVIQAAGGVSESELRGIFRIRLR